MKKLQFILMAALMAATFSACDEYDDPSVPSQDEIETKIIGKWKRTRLNGQEQSTNQRQIATFETDGKMFSTTTLTVTGKSQWEFRAPFDYVCDGNKVCSRVYFDNGELRSEVQYEVEEINDRIMRVRMFRTYSDGHYQDVSTPVEYQRVTNDYTRDVIGLWEGVEMTGETYGGADARIEFRPDGTYTYFNHKDGEWVASDNVGNEYNVDGDWLATRWRPVPDADYVYERWDIDEIKDGIMKWSAIRDGKDGTRFFSTFTWKKINNE